MEKDPGLVSRSRSRSSTSSIDAGDGKRIFRGAHRICGLEACRQILLLGEDNPLSADPRYALFYEPSGSAGHRLQSRILGVRAGRTYLSMWRSNLCAGEWQMRRAVRRASSLFLDDGETPWRLVVALGQRVSGALDRALGTRLVPFCEPMEVPGTSSRVIAIPHPSGRNLVWNNVAKIQLARALLRSAAPEVPWGELDEAGVVGAAVARGVPPEAEALAIEADRALARPDNHDE